jgi:hypothetical protein
VKLKESVSKQPSPQKRKAVPHQQSPQQSPPPPPPPAGQKISRMTRNAPKRQRRLSLPGVRQRRLRINVLALGTIELKREKQKLNEKEDLQTNV